MGENMKVGFTGTQKGMTEAQRDGVVSVWKALRPVKELHHGDCIGADAQANDLFDVGGKLIVLHTPSDERKQAHCFAHWADLEKLAPLPYLERNANIVKRTEVLVAAPFEMFRENEPHSGTWWTVRYARERHRPVVIVRPDGFIRAERCEALGARFVGLARWCLPTLYPTEVKPAGERGTMTFHGMVKLKDYPEDPRGEALRVLRIEKNLGLREGARLFGITAPEMSGLEFGRYTLTDLGWSTAHNTLASWSVLA